MSARIRFAAAATALATPLIAALPAAAAPQISTHDTPDVYYVGSTITHTDGTIYIAFCDGNAGNRDLATGAGTVGAGEVSGDIGGWYREPAAPGSPWVGAWGSAPFVLTCQDTAKPHHY